MIADSVPTFDALSGELHIVDRDVIASRARRYMSATPRPFVKWAGSKRALLPQIVPYLPDSFTSYHEPFLGGGALLLLLQPTNAVVNDSAPELVNAWRSVRSDVDGVYRSAIRNRLEKAEYYRVRANRSTDAVERAGEFLFLNRGCFNGIYRVNARGEFNVPWGAPKSASIVDEVNLRAVSSFLNEASIDVILGDFEPVVDGAGLGSLVFLDPPYVTRHNSNGFVDYNERIFSWADQVRLALAAERARRRGSHVLVTNAMHSDVTGLYPSFKTIEITRASTLAGDSTKRARSSEVLLVGTPDER